MKQKIKHTLVFAAGMVIGLLSYHFFLKRDSNNFIVNNQDLSWIFNKKNKITIGENFLYASKTNQTPAIVKGGVNSQDGFNAIKYFRIYTDTCKRFKANPTFSISYSKNEILKYFSNIESLTEIDSVRIYFGMYPANHRIHPNRLTGFLVAVGLDKKEKYLDNNPGLQIINLGTLCPTDCPPANTIDPNSLYEKAGRPK